MNGEGFAFFRWRTMCHPYIGDDAGWWEFYCRYDFWQWSELQKLERRGEPCRMPT